MFFLSPEVLYIDFCVPFFILLGSSYDILLDTIDNVDLNFTGRTLTLADLRRLATVLSSAASKWQVLGQELGLSPDDLPQPETHYEDAVYLNKVLSSWLTRQSPAPTLDFLSGVLCQPLVGEQMLAAELLQGKSHWISQDNGLKDVQYSPFHHSLFSCSKPSGYQ